MSEDLLNENSVPAGPFVYSNWFLANKGAKVLCTYEYHLLTDARIIGELREGYGPYSFLNPVPIENKPGMIQPCLFLRVDIHLSSALPGFNKIITDHRGWLPEEIAALTSLALGIRLKAGGITRIFEPNSDPLGKPIGWDFKPNPILLFGHYNLILPSVVGGHSVEDLEPLAKLLTISPENIIALIRAAKLYQDALWIAESEPALSWIMLVSALETGANQWRRERESPLDRLKVSKPKLFRLLEETGINELPENVAKIISDSLGSTKKFIDFVLEFLPNQPIRRPAQWGQIDWSTTKIKKNLRKIYSYRSKALHGGIPFPAPMCLPPFRHPKWEAYTEKPLPPEVRKLGGKWSAIWSADEIPMLLHSFEYITRGTLLNWWKYLCKI